MKLRRLLDPFHGYDFWQHLGKKPGLVQKLEPPPGRAFRQQLRKFIAQALRRNLIDLANMPAYGIERLRLNFETKASGEAHRPQQSQLVLAKTAIRFADCPDNPGRQISLPADIVEYLDSVV